MVVREPLSSWEMVPACGNKQVMVMDPTIISWDTTKTLCLSACEDCLSYSTSDRGESS